MDRLTKKNGSGGYYYPKCFEKCNGFGASSKCNNCEITTSVCEKLGKYEDLEEQCRLIKLPCKVVDVVYRINIGAMKPVIPLRVVEYRFKIFGNCIREKICCSDDFLCKQPSIIYYAEDIDNKVFLTKSEAEAKLKELRGGE